MTARRRFEPLWIVTAVMAVVALAALWSLFSLGGDGPEIDAVEIGTLPDLGVLSAAGDGPTVTNGAFAPLPAPGTPTTPAETPATSTSTTSTSTSTSTTSTSTTSSSTTSTTLPGPEVRVLGRSVNGTEIVAVGTGDPAGIPVLAVGSIHGNEPGGHRVIDELRNLDIPLGIRLWLIETVNPDGIAAGTRTNARGVDLNRNADSGTWESVGAGTSRYSGPGPASEPETQATQAFIDEIQPVLSLWYHQAAGWVDDNTSVFRYDLLTSYAEYVGMDKVETSCVTACVGTVSSYVNRTVDGGSAWVVELPSDVSGDLALRHAVGFMRISSQLAALPPIANPPVTTPEDG